MSEPCDKTHHFGGCLGCERDALRSRVEALEGALRDVQSQCAGHADDFSAQVYRIAEAALRPDKGEDCATCYGGGLVNRIDPHHPPVACPACDGTGLEPDKGERCETCGGTCDGFDQAGRGCPDCQEAP